jgi:hypothetical protein
MWWSLLRLVRGVLYFYGISSLHGLFVPQYASGDRGHRSKAVKSNEYLLGVAQTGQATVFGFGYVLGFFPGELVQESCLIASAWLCWDIVHKFHQRQRWSLMPAYSFKRSDIPSNGSNANGEEQQFWQVTVHHVVTLLLLQGWFYSADAVGLAPQVCFLVSELPMCLCNLSWYWYYHDNVDALGCTLLAWGAVITWFLLRVVLYPLLFLTVIVPQLNWIHLLNPLFWLWHGLVLLVFAGNVWNWYRLLKRTRSHSPL